MRRDNSSRVSRSGDAAGGTFWLILHEPGCVPELKGSWPWAVVRTTLREFIAARPTAYIDVLTFEYDQPDIQWGPELLQMLDGRSMSIGRRHNKQTAEAHAHSHGVDMLIAPPSAPSSPRSFRFGDYIENGWASERNPTRRGYFVRFGVRAARMNAGPFVEVTDGHGKFWTVVADREHKLRLLAKPTSEAALAEGSEPGMNHDA